MAGLSAADCDEHHTLPAPVETSPSRRESDLSREVRLNAARVREVMRKAAAKQKAAPYVAALPQVPLIGTECSICLNTASASMMRRLPCSHCFHEECLLRWLQSGQMCPNCRVDLL
mmetsp:Transcript_58728/g.139944  ORF Transcript_58728/g.139944 Transcript_58728/m.139944 type:complete len:116 (-) Transcript_58728:47-394(-)